MKTIVAIIVFDRFTNIEHWLECWEKCEHDGAELVIIHNHDTEDLRFTQICEQYGVKYIRHPNVGYDIGRFQDICRGRLDGFPEWDRVLWIVDDALPMAYDFVKQFNQAMRKGVGVACMEISPYVTPHIRTSGFMIDKATAEKLVFPADPITTKKECFNFEHRSRQSHFYYQIKKMGLQVVQVAEKQTSPLWDTGYHRRLDRRAEHERKFGEHKSSDKVLIICPIYKSYPAIISSLVMQTHKNWELVLIHDGPDTENVASQVGEDPRVTFMETPKHGGKWGHYIRQIGLQMFHVKSDYIIVTNPDNFYAPPALAYMIKTFETHPSAIAVYFSQIIHSYTNWKVMNCRLEQGFLDCGGVMVRAEVAAAVPWESISDHSADWIWFEAIINKYGAGRFQKVDSIVFIHN